MPAHLLGQLFGSTGGTGMGMLNSSSTAPGEGGRPSVGDGSGGTPFDGHHTAPASSPGDGGTIKKRNASAA
jgi:hypothetical protein